MRKTLEQLHIEKLSPDPVLQNELVFRILRNAGGEDDDLTNTPPAVASESAIFDRDSRWGADDNYDEDQDDEEHDIMDLDELLNSSTAAQAAAGVRDLFKQKNKQFMGKF